MRERERERERNREKGTCNLSSHAGPMQDGRSLKRKARVAFGGGSGGQDCAHQTCSAACGHSLVKYTVP